MATAEPAPRGLAEAIGATILEGIRTDAAPGDHLEIVRRTAHADREIRLLLHQAVASARAAGHSWTVIGAELGMSRQAAQQRFGGDRAAGTTALAGQSATDQDDGPDERWLGPVTAFDEMRELEIAGRLGWRTVGAGMMKHRVRRGPTQWEHRRVAWTRSTHRFERDGWEVAVRAFPWLYLVRDTGLPVPGP